MSRFPQVTNSDVGFFFVLSLFKSESVCECAGGAERGRDRESQAGSELSAQSLMMQGSKSRTMIS